MAERPSGATDAERTDGRDDAERSAVEPAADGTRKPDRGLVARNGWILVFALLAVPMAVIPASGDLTVVSLWGFINPAASDSGFGIGGYPVWSYFIDQSRPFSALPPSIRAWPLALGFHLFAAGSAASGAAFDREDRRVTGGLLVLAATASLWVSVGLAARFGVGTTSGLLTVLPVGAVATLAVAVAAYGSDIRGIVEA